MSTAFAWPAHVGWRALLGGLTNGLRKHIGWLRGDVTESIWSGSSSLRGTALVGVVRRSVSTRRWSRLFPGVNDSGRRFFSITTKISRRDPRPCPHEYHPP